MTFGIHSVLLLIGIFQALVFAVLLALTTYNTVANRFMAMLLVLVAMSITPNAIGFAGAYDTYPWLMFAPLSVGLGFGPALWLYSHRLLTGSLPKRWGAHLIPLALQLGYYTALFAQPLAKRYEFNGLVHLPVMTRVELAASVLSLAFYWSLTGRMAVRYTRHVAQLVSDSANYNVRWLLGYITATAVVTIAWLTFEFVNLFVTPLSHQGFFWLDLAAAALAYWLAVSAYQHSARPWPELDTKSSRLHFESTDSGPNKGDPGDTDVTPVDRWARSLQRIRKSMESEQLFLDPTLSLESLARKLNSNSWEVSRAINAGAGCSFSDFVNHYRVERVKERLEDPEDPRTVLAIGLDCGFNSKTSFNRCFKHATGTTPSQYRLMNRRAKS